MMKSNTIRDINTTNPLDDTFGYDDVIDVIARWFYF